MRNAPYWKKFPFYCLHFLLPVFSVFFILGDVDPPGSHYQTENIMNAAKLMWLPLLILMGAITSKQKAFWNPLGFVPSMAVVSADAIWFGNHWFDSFMMFGVLHYMAMVLAGMAAFVAMVRRYEKRKGTLFFEIFMTLSLIALPGGISLLYLGRHLWELEYGLILFVAAMVAIILEASVFLRDFDKMTELDKVKS